ncbi:helicase MOV-10 [Discoglossus pictus]
MGRRQFDPIIQRIVAEHFLKYLKDAGKEHVEDKEELRNIYSEFRRSDDTRKPNFSATIYFLKTRGKAKVTKNKVDFHETLRRRTVSLMDQYLPMRKDQRQKPKPPGDCNREQAQTIIKFINKNRSQFIGEKNGISVTSDHDIDNGRIRFRLSLGEQIVFPIIIENRSNKTVIFQQYKELRRMRVFSFQDEHKVSKANPLTLNPGDRYEVSVRCFVKSTGYFPITMVFEFVKEEDTSSNFVIGRFLSAIGKSKFADQLAPTSKFVPYQKNLLRPIVRNEDEGIPPESLLNYELEREISLNNYIPPHHLKDCIKAGVFLQDAPVINSKSIDMKDRDLLSSCLDFNNYDKRFSMLLHLEEIQMELYIRRFDRENQKMERDTNQKLLALHVPGVAENRPSVLKGDHLFVTLADERGQSGIISYKGYVHAVELERVKLGFSSNLLRKFINGLMFDVTFTFNRLPLRVQHRAVTLAKENNLKEILFPSCSYNESIVDVNNLSLYDRNVQNNSEQYNAVKQIVSGMSRPAPYLLFGPPGTGKTITLVEAIKQVLKYMPQSRVLACAPSNSATDLLCQRLLKHVAPRDIYRLIASSRDFRFVPEDIKECCNWDSINGNYVYPSKQVLKKYKVIITTLVTAGRNQLGPILRSPVAIENGLDKSLLERLMTQNALYKKNDVGYNSQFVTKLLKNYRSHPDILYVPNDLFYDNELLAEADEMITHSYCSWEKLPRKGFPIIFHGVLGKDEREGNSPSFFNINEIEEVMTYLEYLLKSQGKKGLAKISPKEIGIISPYRKQVEKIRQAIKLSFNGVNDIKDLQVGSVEEFQGLERKVIIISTVRSCQDYVKFDEDFSLGFLKNPKRFNVAVTRAKALLILVGNPIILRQDPNWCRYLKFCIDKGGYTGYEYEEKPLDEKDIADLLASLNINGPQAGENTGESFVQT